MFIFSIFKFNFYKKKKLSVYFFDNLLFWLSNHYEHAYMHYILEGPVDVLADIKLGQDFPFDSL